MGSGLTDGGKKEEKEAPAKNSDHLTHLENLRNDGGNRRRAPSLFLDTRLLFFLEADRGRPNFALSPAQVSSTISNRSRDEFSN
jgi:hypothetical protein